jgi:hypothetical protein
MKDKKEDWEKELSTLWARSFDNQKDVDRMLAFIRSFLEKSRQPHKTKDGYCCACEYDIAVFESNLKEEREKILREVGELVDMNRQIKFRDDEIKCYICLYNTSNSHNADGFCSLHSTRGYPYKIDLCTEKGQHICSRSVEEHLNYEDLIIWRK